MAKKYLLVLPLVLLILAAGLIIFLRHKASPIPETVRQKASFSIFYPLKATNGITPDRSSITYDTTNNGLSYTVFVDNKKVIVSEQATPDIFNENGVYAFKLNQAHEYDNFTTSAGEIALTRPEDLGGQTVAWLNNHGTLTLVRAPQGLSSPQWQMFFNQLGIVQP